MLDLRLHGDDAVKYISYHIIHATKPCRNDIYGLPIDILCKKNFTKWGLINKIVGTWEV